MVKESTLTDSLIQYLAISLDDMKSVLESFNPADWTAPAFSHQDSLQKLKQDMEREKEELKILVKQKIKEIASDPAMSEIISETYDGLQKEKAERAGHRESDSPRPRSFAWYRFQLKNRLEFDEWTHRQ